MYGGRVALQTVSSLKPVENTGFPSVAYSRAITVIASELHRITESGIRHCTCSAKSRFTRVHIHVCSDTRDDFHREIGREFVGRCMRGPLANARPENVHMWRCIPCGRPSTGSANKGGTVDEKIDLREGMAKESRNRRVILKSPSSL